ESADAHAATRQRRGGRAGGGGAGGRGGRDGRSRAVRDADPPTGIAEHRPIEDARLRQGPGGLLTVGILVAPVADDAAAVAPHAGVGDGGHADTQRAWTGKQSVAERAATATIRMIAWRRRHLAIREPREPAGLRLEERRDVVEIRTRRTAGRVRRQEL